MKIYLMRHGQTDYNKNRLMQGSLDISLNETGIEQAKNAQAIIDTLDFKVVYTGDLKRQIETSRIVCANKKDLCFKMDPNFNEIDFGSFEGKSIEYMGSTVAKKTGINNVDSLNALQIEDACHNGDPLHLAEDSKSVIARIEKGLFSVLKEKENVLIVSSGMLLHSLLLTYVKDFENVHIHNCSIVELTYENGKFIGRNL